MSAWVSCRSPQAGLVGLASNLSLPVMLQALSSVHTLLYDWMQPNPGVPHLDASPIYVLWQAWPLGSAPDCACGSAADDMRVAPLFKHVFPPAAAPSLAFIGLLFKSLRNTQFELQARPSQPLFCLLLRRPLHHRLSCMRKI